MVVEISKERWQGHLRRKFPIADNSGSFWPEVMNNTLSEAESQMHQYVDQVLGTDTNSQTSAANNLLIKARNRGTLPRPKL